METNFLKSAIDLSDIVFGHKLSCNENYIISFVTFCIFKFWILGNKNKITVDIHNFKIFLKHELLYESEVLKQTKNQNTFKELLSLSMSIVYYCVYTCINVFTNIYISYMYR